MMIFWNAKLAFLAVPKTGTTAIESALAPHASISFRRQPNLKHMTHQRFNRFIRPYLKKEGKEDVEMVAVMREPISWLGSWYRYRQRPALENTSNSTRNVSFDEFVQAYVGGSDRPDFAKIGSQARMLSVSRSQVGMDHLFKYENLPAFTRFLSERLEREIAFPTMNVSPKLEIELSPETEDRLRRKYALDFETYNAIGDPAPEV